MSRESLRTGSLWMIAGQGVAMAAQAVYFVLIGRSLGTHEYGAFVGVAALIGALSQFSSLGMEIILVRNISRDRASFARTWGQSLLIASAGFFLLLAAAMLFAHFALPPNLRPLVPWLTLSDGLLGKLVQLAARAFQGAGRLAWTARLTALTAVGRALAASAVWLWTRAHGVPTTALLWARIYWLSTFVVAGIAILLVTFHLGGPRFTRVRRGDLSQGLSFSLSSSSISLYNDLDKTFLVSLGQLYSASIYSAAYRVVDAASAPLYAIYAAAAPRFFAAGARSVQAACTLARSILARTLPLSLASAALLASVHRSCPWSSAHPSPDRPPCCAGFACCRCCVPSTTPGAPPSPPPPRSGTAPPPNSALRGSTSA